MDTFYFYFDRKKIWILEKDGQNGPIPPFLEIFSKKTLFRK